MQLSNNINNCVQNFRLDHNLITPKYFNMANSKLVLLPSAMKMLRTIPLKTCNINDFILIRNLSFPF